MIDFETIKWTKFLIGGIYDGDRVIFTESVEECLDILLADYNGYDVFAHFGGTYDFLFVLDAALPNPHIKIGPIIPRGSSILTFDISHGNHRVVFHDSSALFPFSLKKLTKAFGVKHKKKEIDYDAISEVTEELKEYLEYDLKGLYECIEKFYDWPLIKEAGGAYTRASQAIRILRTTLEKPIYALSSELDKEIRRGYFGGRVEIFKPVYKGTKPLYCYDVNSLYPTVMREYEYPNGFKHETNHYEKGELAFYEATINVPKDIFLPPFGISHNGKYVFPVGKVKGIFASCELEYAEALGYDFTVKKGWIFSSAGFLFRKFVDMLHALKKNAKDGVDRTLAKDMMNSCYGRCGLNDEDKENIILDDGAVGRKHWRDVTINGTTYVFATEKAEMHTFSNVAIAAFVTAHARIYMHKLMLQCQDQLYYTDTDSIFTTHEFPESEELGGLKKEPINCNEESHFENPKLHKRECFEAHDCCFLLPKTYISGKKIVMKGFDKKKIQHFTYDDFMNCLEGDLKSLKIVQEPRFMKFKTALRKKTLVGMTKSSTREIRSVYDKRIVTNSRGMAPNFGYDTKPIEISA